MCPLLSPRLLPQLAVGSGVCLGAASLSLGPLFPNSPGLCGMSLGWFPPLRPPVCTFLFPGSEGEGTREQACSVFALGGCYLRSTPAAPSPPYREASCRSGGLVTIDGLGCFVFCWSWRGEALKKLPAVSNIPPPHSTFSPSGLPRSGALRSGAPQREGLPGTCLPSPGTDGGSWWKAFQQKVLSPHTARRGSVQPLPGPPPLGSPEDPSP